MNNMTPEAKAAFETGVMCMRLLASHDDVAETKRNVIQLENYRASRAANRTTNGECDAANS